LAARYLTFADDRLGSRLCENPMTRSVSVSAARILKDECLNLYAAKSAV
jgi:hypothetical protein